jgi:hypothetical protein
VACNIYISSSCSAGTGATTATSSSTDPTAAAAANNHVSHAKNGLHIAAASSSSHHPLLLQVLDSSQELCRQLRSKDQNARIAIVHAYADKAYDRSSFHLAGRAKEVAQVSSHVATTAIDLLVPSLLMQSRHVQTPTQIPNDAPQQQQDGNDGCDMVHSNAPGTTRIRCASSASRHPLVGLVDHVSVMPLVSLASLSSSHSSTSSKTNNDHYDDDDDIDDDPCNKTNQERQQQKEFLNADTTVLPSDVNASALAALQILHALELKGVRCLPYGTAHPKGIPLATVRREWTDFFKSGSLSHNKEALYYSCMEEDENDALSSLLLGTCTVGSPTHFVENFNIRLTRHVTKKQAMALTKRVRQRDGGVLGVEALTLPYSNGRWEVACNLLMPHEKEGTVDCIMEQVNEWLQKDMTMTMCANTTTATTDTAISSTTTTGKGLSLHGGYSHYVEDCYRVGTTMDQCMTVVLNLLKDEVAFQHYDDMVRQGFEANLLVDHTE